MKFRSILLTILISLFIGITGVYAKEKVKVYIFEAGGCPYCEAQKEYFEELAKTNDKFEVIVKELYVDHIDWEEGKDYDLGVKVAKEFNAAGFSNASYQGTPFVVISDIYAASAYSTSLENYINKAYEEGDKDAVSCIAKGNGNCIRTDSDIDDNDNTDVIIDDTTTIGAENTESSSSCSGNNVVAVVLLSIFLGISVIANIVLIILLAVKKGGRHYGKRK